MLLRTSDPHGKITTFKIVLTDGVELKEVIYSDEDRFLAAQQEFSFCVLKILPAEDGASGTIIVKANDCVRLNGK